MTASRDLPHGSRPLRVGLSLMPSDDFARATAPLFEAGLVDALEWNVDMGFPPASTPAWATDLLDTFSRAGRLAAHGVELSPLSAVWQPHQQRWLEALEQAFSERSYTHLTEHFGFMTAGDFVRGTPLPLPFGEAALALAEERIALLRSVTRKPVGLENLALAFSAADVDQQAAFFRRALEAAGAFSMLDLHNLHCQAENFDLDVRELCARYPLARVKQVHLAGGRLARSRIAPTAKPFRRDSHDDAVPEAVFALLEWLIPRCPSLDTVIVERSDRSMFGDAEADAFRREFRDLRERVTNATATTTATATATPTTTPIPDDVERLDCLQRTMLEVFATEDDPRMAIDRIAAEADVYRDWVSTWEERAVEVGIGLVRQWGTRDAPADTMIAAVLPRVGGTLEMRHLPIPAPGPGQALVLVQASGLCGTDVHVRAGRMHVPFPIVLGHEAVGVVEAVGAGVTSLRVGDRVGAPWVQRGCEACPACARGKVQHCIEPRTWIQNGGGHAGYTLVEASGAVRIPEGLSSEEAAPMLCAGFTVMSGYRRARPRPGDRVAVLGVGGLGHLGIQIARAFGHEVVAVTSSPSKRAELLRLGAHEVIEAGDDPGAALADAGGADVILSTTSSALHAGLAVTGLRPEGRLSLIGLGEGAVAIDPMALMLCLGSIVGAVQDNRADLVDVLALAAQRKVVPVLETYPMLLAERAMTRLAEGRVRYRAVLTM